LELAIDCDGQRPGEPRYEIEAPDCEVVDDGAALAAGKTVVRKLTVTPKASGELSIALVCREHCEPWRDGQHTEEVKLQVNKPRAPRVQLDAGLMGGQGPFRPGSTIQASFSVDVKPEEDVEV